METMCPFCDSEAREPIARKDALLSEVAQQLQTWANDLPMFAARKEAHELSQRIVAELGKK